MNKLVLIFLFFATIFAAPMDEPLEPINDPFYLPPPGFENEASGTILKIRKTPQQVRSVYFPVNIQNAWQVLVKSEDAKGNDTAVVATIFEPYNGNSSRLVSYNIAEDASAFKCSPSYSFLGGGGIHTLVGKLEMFLIQAALDQGYYVVSADYEGPISAFTVGPLSGMSVLNSIRAALSSTNTTNIDPDAEVVLWGYSGGTIAGGWAAAMQPSYAEELSNNLIGAALGGWVTNITATAEIVEGSIFAGLVPNAILGLLNQYPELGRVFNAELSQEKFELFNRSNEFCLVDSILYYPFEKFFTGENRYAESGWEVLSDETIQQVLQENTLGVEVTEGLMPEIPIFIYHGILDEIVPFKDAQRMYDIWCDQGIESFEFAVSNSTGHILEVIEGSGAALKWIKDRFDGVPPTNGCERTARSTNLLYPGALTGYANIFSALIANVFGFEIGPDDNENGERLAKRALNRRDIIFP